MPRTKPAKDAPEWAAGLTTRERTFVEHYIISLNATKAALAAGYGSKGAAVRGHELLGRPAVAKAVAALVAERAGVTGSHVLARLGSIVNTNVDDVMEVRDGIVVVKDTSELSPEALIAVAGYEERVNERGHRVIIPKLYSKIDALSLLAKILGMRRSPTSEAPAVTVNIQNNVEAGDRVMARVNEIINRRQALPAPSQEQMPLLSPVKIEDPENVE
jgi:phage terminase small subunit